MRRVNWVRIVVVDGHARCEAVGIGHRLPTVRAVSVETAMALAGSGVPSVIRFGDRDADAEAAHASAGG
jgi:hypothetical protein